jgi:hypothetical protein
VQNKIVYIVSPWINFSSNKFCLYIDLKKNAHLDAIAYSSSANLSEEILRSSKFVFTGKERLLCLPRRAAPGHATKHVSSGGGASTDGRDATTPPESGYPPPAISLSVAFRHSHLLRPQGTSRAHTTHHPPLDSLRSPSRSPSMSSKQQPTSPPSLPPPWPSAPARRSPAEDAVATLRPCPGHARSPPWTP